MARQRMRAATRKALARSQQARDPAQIVAAGVLQTARDVAAIVPAGALYWHAPLQYVAEQMAPRVCQAHGLPDGRADDVAAYLLAAVNEYVVALVGEFDVEHFEAWTAAEGRPAGKEVASD